MIRVILIALLGLVPRSAGALPLELPPHARMTAERTDPSSDIAFPTSPFESFDPVSDRAAGQITHQAWRTESSHTTRQLIEPLRAQLEAGGYDVVFECRDTVCGGFDFRFALDLIGEPDMHVDLGDYRYLAARRVNGAKPDYAMIVASRSAAFAFLHITRVGPEAAPQMQVAPAPDPSAEAGDLIAELSAAGRVVLDDLVFQTGSARLGDGPFPTLMRVAEYLRSAPDARIVLVGHTDAVGALDQNIALSRARAAAVLDRLVGRYSVSPAQLQADGIGFLMPRARNDTEEGRALNRRVEVVLLPAP